MSDSDLLGIIARNPQPKKYTSSRFRPTSPKAVANHSRDRLLSPSPPASPDPLFRRSGDDDPALDDSASLVAERLQAQPKSTTSSLLGVMHNDEVVAPESVGLQNRFHGPIRVGHQSFNLKNYGDPVPLFQLTDPPPLLQTFSPPSLLPISDPEPTAEMVRADQELKTEKEHIIVELSLKKSKGYDVPPHLGFQSPIEDLRTHIASIRRLENHKRTVSMLRYLMVIGCTGVEKATMALLSDVYLEGWSESVAANQDDYNEVVGRIADTMDLSTSIPPHVELVVMLGVSGVLYHMSKKNQVGILGASEPKNDTPPIKKDGPTQSLSEEQLRIHNLITGTSATNCQTDYDAQSGSSLSPNKPRTKKARMTVDSDEIVRLF